VSGITGSKKTASVLLGKGDGTFQPALSDAWGTRLISVAVGDLTGGGSAGQAGRKVRRECAGGNGHGFVRIP